jgi:nitroreductase
MANSLQSLIQSRYTAVHFEPMQPEQLKRALDRAIACAQAAPNHHRTEPFFFKRLLAPSSSTQRLADIAARVVFAKKSKSDPRFAQAHADRKRDKWNRIPAFLVALVANQSPVQDAVDGDDDDYAPLEFSPPQTERQLEDVSFMLHDIYISNYEWVCDEKKMIFHHRVLVFLLLHTVR